MISSRENVLLKDMRRLRRSKGGRDGNVRRILLEGPHLIEEAVKARLEFEALLATPTFLASADGQALLPRLPRRPLETAPEILHELADADSPRGLVAVVRKPLPDLKKLARQGLFVFADGIQDPGNLGALARVAEAAGVAALFAGLGTCDPTNPRALRASAGSLLRLPFFERAAIAEVDQHFAERAVWVTLEPTAKKSLWDFAPVPTTILVLGSEGRGVAAELSRRADVQLHIPMAGVVESLNVVTAAAVTLFEWRRAYNSSTSIESNGSRVRG